MTIKEIKELHKSLLPIYKQAEGIALKYYRVENQAEEKFDINNNSQGLVTLADKEINDLFISELPKFVKNSAVIGEEGSSSEFKDIKYFWVVDPIDGTNNYAMGVDMWGISVSLWKNSESIYSCILFPRAFDSMFYSIAGNGVFNHKDESIILKPKHYKSSYAIVANIDFKNYFYNNVELPIRASYRSFGNATFETLPLILSAWDFILIYDLPVWDITGSHGICKELNYDITYIGKPIDISKGADFTKKYTVLISKPDVTSDIIDEVNRIIEQYEES